MFGLHLLIYLSQVRRMVSHIVRQHARPQLDLVDQFICPLCVESAYIRQPSYATTKLTNVQRILTSICARPGNAVA
jgi:hypothetical protein